MLAVEPLPPSWRTLALISPDLRRHRITAAGATALEAVLQHKNYSLEEMYLHGRNSEVLIENQRDRIRRHCLNNRHMKAAFEQWKNELQSLSLGLMPFVLDRFGDKPDLLFAILKAKPVAVMERRKRRKLRY